MAITVTSRDASFPLVGYMYWITGLVGGANAITLPTAPTAGSFPILTATTSDWIPTFVYCWPYAYGAVGALVTPDLSTIAYAASALTFTLYAADSTDCLILVA
jgi:hypothetical protein